VRAGIFQLKIFEIINCKKKAAISGGFNFLFNFLIIHGNIFFKNTRESGKR